MNVIDENFKGTTIIHGDTLEVLKSFPDKLFGGIITDPPYASGAATQNGKQQSEDCGAGRHHPRSVCRGRYYRFGGKAGEVSRWGH